MRIRLLRDNCAATFTAQPATVITESPFLHITRLSERGAPALRGKFDVREATKEHHFFWLMIRLVSVFVFFPYLTPSFHTPIAPNRGVGFL